MKTRPILMMITVLSALAFATSAMAMESAPIPCESDDDCMDEKQLCLDGTCGWHGTEAASCESDTDCADGTHCVWSSCTEVGEYCKTDDDCGEYMKCGDAEFGSGSSSSSGGMGMTPTETDMDGEDSGDAEADMFMPAMCETDAECSEEEICLDGYCEWAEDEAEPVEIETGESWGICSVDPDQVPVDDTCAAMCEHVATCMEDSPDFGEVVITETTEEAASTDTPSSDEEDEAELPMLSCEFDADCLLDDEVCIDGLCQRASGGGMDIPPPAPSEEDLAQITEICTTMCSYAVLQEVGLTELNTLAQCLEDNADSDDGCASMEACEGAADAWGDVIEASGIDDDLAGSMAVPGNTRSANDDSNTESNNGTASGGDGTDLAASDDTEGEEPPSSGGDSGGCGTSHTPVIPWLVLMAIGSAALLRRRQTA